MKNAFPKIAGIFLVAFVIIMVVLTAKVIDGINNPKVVQIGPHRTHIVRPDESFYSENDTPVSFKGDCHFILINHVTGEITLPEITPAALGEESPTYTIEEIVLDGNYSVDLCWAEAYAEQDTTLTVSNGPFIRFIYIFLIIILAIVLTCRICLIVINAITDV